MSIDGAVSSSIEMTLAGINARCILLDQSGKALLPGKERGQDMSRQLSQLTVFDTPGSKAGGFIFFRAHPLFLAVDEKADNAYSIGKIASAYIRALYNGKSTPTKSDRAIWTRCCGCSLLRRNSSVSCEPM